jgi:hypothetical protein
MPRKIVPRPTSGWVGDLLTVGVRRQVGILGLGSFFATREAELGGAPGMSKTHTIFRAHEMYLVQEIEFLHATCMGTIYNMPII